MIRKYRGKDQLSRNAHIDVCRKIRPTRLRDESAWSLLHGLATDAVRGRYYDYATMGNQNINGSELRMQPGCWEGVR